VLQIKELNDSSWSDKPLTKWVESVVVKKTQRAGYKENTEQVQEGLKVYIEIVCSLVAL